MEPKGFKRLAEVNDIFLRIENEEEETLNGCPPKPLGGEVLLFRKACQNDTGHLCDAYAGWKSNGSKLLQFGITRAYYFMPGNNFRKSVSSRNNCVMVEYHGSCSGVEIRRNIRTSKHILDEVIPFESDRENKCNIPGLSIKQIQNKLYRIGKKSTNEFLLPHLQDHTYCTPSRFGDPLPLQTNYQCLESYLRSINGLRLPAEIKDPDLRCLEVKGWLSAFVLDELVQKFADYVIPVSLWVGRRRSHCSNHMWEWILRLRVPASATQPVFIPISESSHFMLGVITKTHIVLLDSFQSAAPDSAKNEKIFKRLKFIANAVALINEWGVNSWKLVVASDFTRQIDSSECGVIVIFGVISVLMGWDFANELTVIQQERNRAWLLGQFCMKPPQDAKESKALTSKSIVQNKMSELVEEAIHFEPARAIIRHAVRH